MEINSIEQMLEYAAANGDENGIRMQDAAGFFQHDMRTQRFVWQYLKVFDDQRAAIAKYERETLERRALEATARSVEAADRSTAAAERSAKSTKFAAWAAAAGAAFTAAGVWPVRSSPS